MAEPNGLYYMRARYYDPETGRFISEDPIGFEGGDVNLYVYVGNNPIGAIDPNGQDIYLMTGNNVTLPFTDIKNPLQDALHQSIVVDTPHGKRGFSFGMSGVGITVSSTWLGQDSPTATILKGQIYETGYTQGRINDVVHTTSAQDAEFVKYLSSRVGEEGGYSIARHNCRKFSQSMFDRAKSQYGK
jgi:RHS repeat-associated protein